MPEDNPQHIVDLRRRMVRMELGRPTSQGHDAWIPVFERVPRHVFLPRIRSLGKGTLLDGADPQTRSTWLEHTYSGMLVCLPDDHAPMSLCRLRIGDLADLFEQAGITEGQRVLVLGAGQGYGPALLCERLGDSHVTVTDPNPSTLDDVAGRLHAADYQPTMVVSTAENGHPTGAPYDGIITNDTRDTLPIPPAWLAQVKPGGKMLVVLSSKQVIVLDVQENGTAEGRFMPDTRFIAPWMPPHWATPAERSNWPAPRYERRTTTLPAHACDGSSRSNPGFMLHVRLHIGEIDNETTAMYGSYNTSYRHRDGSWANINSDDRTTWDVTEGGPRKLWTEIETLYQQWRELSEPELTNYRLTVTPESQTVMINGAVDWP